MKFRIEIPDMALVAAPPWKVEYVRAAVEHLATEPMRKSPVRMTWIVTGEVKDEDRPLFDQLCKFAGVAG